MKIKNIFFIFQLILVSFSIISTATVYEINQNGGSAYLTTLKGLGHSNVHNKVYQNTFTTPDGDQDTPLEWAFKQSKSKNKAKKNGNTKTA